MPISIHDYMPFAYSQGPPLTIDTVPDVPEAPTNWVTIHELTMLDAPAGEYMATISVLWHMDSTIYSAYFKAFLGEETVNFVREEPKDASDIVIETYNLTRTHLGGDLTARSLGLCENATQPLEVVVSTIAIKRVD